MQMRRNPLQIIFQALLTRGISSKNQNKVGFHIYQKTFVILTNDFQIKNNIVLWSVKRSGYGWFRSDSFERKKM